MRLAVLLTTYFLLLIFLIHRLFTKGIDWTDNTNPTVGTSAFRKYCRLPSIQNARTATKYVSKATTKILVKLVSHALSFSTRALRFSISPILRASSANRSSIESFYIRAKHRTPFKNSMRKREQDASCVSIQNLLRHPRNLYLRESLTMTPKRLVVTLPSLELAHDDLVILSMHDDRRFNFRTRNIRFAEYCGLTILRKEHDFVEYDFRSLLSLKARNMNFHTFLHFLLKACDVDECKHELRQCTLQPKPMQHLYQPLLEDFRGTETLRSIVQHCIFVKYNVMELIIPSLRYIESYKSALAEFDAHGISGFWQKFGKVVDENSTINKIKNLDVKAELASDMVPSTVYWLIDNDTFIGHVSIRHELNAALQQRGGHIGYAIRPSMQKKGYGSRLLELAIPKVKALGIEKALVTCDKENIASRKIIERNKGVLLDEIEVNKKAIMRFWISL